jgi:mannose-6-phosphate isomerase
MTKLRIRLYQMRENIQIEMAGRMKNPQLYPLKFNPIYKHYLWGGKNLTKMGKQIAEDEIVAESWEIADHGEDVSIVRNGPLAGRSLRELIELFGQDLCPESSNGRFPIIIKFLDANKRLSVQVHPDDEYATKHESPTELGKNECWYILDAPPDAELIFGIKKGVTKQEFQKLVEKGRIEDGLNRLQIKSGDFLFIKTGTVHALLEGTMVCEILQNSDTTYRLYDWERLGADGKPRPLHIEKALDVIRFSTRDEYEQELEKLVFVSDSRSVNRTQLLLQNSHFNIEHLNYQREFSLAFRKEHFHALIVITGSGEINHTSGTTPVRKGETILIPRSIGSYRIQTKGMRALKAFL